jgi:hypothetical protein
MASTISRTRIGDVLAINDPLYGDNFELWIPTLPTGVSGTPGNAKNALRIQCKSVSMPGVQNEAQDLTLHGYKVSVVGRTVFQNTLSITYVETRQLEIYQTLKQWVKACRDWQTQISKGKQAYSTVGNLALFDEQGQVITGSAWTIGNMWCEQVQDINLDGSSASIVEVSASFRYDWFDQVETPAKS